MNQHEWKILSKQKKATLPKDFFLYRNLAVKQLGWKRNAGLVIHHLRDTKEAREFNDKYYERWGIDFDGELKYTILLTIAEHTIIHKISEETKEKIRQNSKKQPIFSKEELKQHIRQSNKRYREENKDLIKQKLHNYYIKNKIKIKAKVKKYRNSHKEAISKVKKEWKIKNREYVNQKKREYYRKTHPLV